MGKFNVIKSKSLTPQQERFCQSYVLDSSAKNAAIKAGYSPKYSAQSGYKLLKHPAIAQRVNELRDELRNRHTATASNVVERYRQMAMTDLASLIVQDPDTGLQRHKRPDELTEDQKALITDITINTSKPDADGARTQTFSYRTVNPKDALDSLARTFGMFRDRVEHEHTHQVSALFEFVMKSPETSETVAILDGRHKRKGATYDG